MSILLMVFVMIMYGFSFWAGYATRGEDNDDGELLNKYYDLKLKYERLQESIRKMEA